MSKERRKAVTMEDVAREAGVSVTTVSHVVNQTATISQDTIGRVQAAIAALGYKPKASAELRGGKRIVGIFAPDIANEFYSNCIQVIFEEAWNHNYAVMVCDTRHHEKVEGSYIKSLIANNICGLIFLGGTADERDILEAAKQVPVVLGDRTIFNHPLDAVVTDNTDIMRRLVAKLAGSGYRRIGFLGQDLEMSNVKDRFMGFKIGLEENGLEMNPDWVHLSRSLRLNKAANANALIKRELAAGRAMPQIYLCSSDLIAIGVMSGLQEEGFRVPRDIGVVGFDDISIAAFTQPPLTTVAQNMLQLGRNCFLALLGQMEGAAHSPQQIVVNAKLVLRGSVRL